MKGIEEEESYNMRWLKAERAVAIAQYEYPVWKNHPVREGSE